MQACKDNICQRHEGWLKGKMEITTKIFGSYKLNFTISSEYLKSKGNSDRRGSRLLVLW